MLAQGASYQKCYQSRLAHSLTAALLPKRSWRGTEAPGRLLSPTGKFHQALSTTEGLSLKGLLLMKQWGSKRRQEAKRMEGGPLVANKELE